MTNLGLAQLYLGAEILQTKDGFWLHQRHYIRQLLKRFEMEDCVTVKTPMDPGLVLRKNMDTPFCDRSLYQEMVGCLFVVGSKHTF